MGQGKGRQRLQTLLKERLRPAGSELLQELVRMLMLQASYFVRLIGLMMVAGRMLAIQILSQPMVLWEVVLLVVM